MRWPWEFRVKAKATDQGTNREVTGPAQTEVDKSYERLYRLNKIILHEARAAEKLAAKDHGR